MRFIDGMVAMARENLKTIVLPENEDARVLWAAAEAQKNGIARIILLGTEEESRKAAPELDLQGIQFIDPTEDSAFSAYIDQYYEMRKAKGMTPEKARENMADKTTFGMMLLKNGRADGLVSGAAHSTANTLRPALQILRTKPGTKLVSAFFVMVTQREDLGENGLFVFGDCGLNENPNAEQLSEIAIASAESFRFFTHKEPRVAMLSYSTYGSAHSDLTEKVAEATRLAQEKRPDLLLDGELQVDASIIPATAARKAPDSKVAGTANVFVFPDLNAGNIGYKLTQYFGRAEAYGPLLQGIAKPVNDLSRGCSKEDVYGVIAITSVQAQAEK